MPSPPIWGEHHTMQPMPYQMPMGGYHLPTAPMRENSETEKESRKTESLGYESFFSVIR